MSGAAGRLSRWMRSKFGLASHDAVPEPGAPLADRLAIALLLLVTGLVLCTFRHYGATFDEAVQDTYGHAIVDWYRSLGAIRTAVTFEDLYFYGGLFDALVALVDRSLPFAHYESRHLLNGLAGIVGLIGCWRFARHLGGPVAGVLALLALALMPSWYGMMCINPKDIPFGAAMVWATYFLTVVAEDPARVRFRSVLWLGIATGCALATRIGGVLLLAYLGAVLALAVARTLPDGLRPAAALAARLGLRVFVPAVLISWAVMLAFWPYAQLDPIGNPLDAWHHFAGREADIPTLYFGRDVGTEYRPLLYLPVYIVLKLPDVTVGVLALGMALAVWQLARVRQLVMPLRFLPLTLGLAIPIGYVLASRPELYDAERHFLFLLPLLAVTTSLIVVRGWALLKTPAARGAVASALLIGAGIQVSEMLRLHPYEYAFFNSLIGGVRGATGQFETEYWGAALSEAAAALAARLQATGETGSVPVGICGEDEDVLTDRLPPNVRVVEDWRSARYYLSTTRDVCDEEVPGQEIARIEREGVPFAVVKELPAAVVSAPNPRPNS